MTNIWQYYNNYHFSPFFTPLFSCGLQANYYPLRSSFLNYKYLFLICTIKTATYREMGNEMIEKVFLLHTSQFLLVKFFSFSLLLKIFNLFQIEIKLKFYARCIYYFLIFVAHFSGTLFIPFYDFLFRF